MKLSCEVKVKHNYKNIKAIIDKLPQTIEKGIENSIKGTAEYAIRLLGTDNNGIVCEMINTETSEIKGRIYTDQNKMPWSWFREYGTGTYAQMPHIGNTKHFLETGFEEWYIPVNKVENSLNYPIKIIDGKQFYVAHSVQAKPFMRPAGFERREQNIQDVQREICKMLEQICK